MTRTIAILGTGLIGASLGLAVGTADPDTAPLGRCHVVGYDADRSQLRTARGRLALDSEARSAAEAVKDADIVVIATPVQAVPELMEEIAPHLRYGAVVTDMCSTKAVVMDWARVRLPTSVSFVGGHPMAGKERGGAEHAEIDLFKGAIYCLCPAVNARPEAVDMVSALVETIGGKPYFIDPDEHDAYVAAVSHLPFVLSIALTSTVTRSPAWKEMQLLAASGFRDISRLAAGDPTMHRDICLTNPTSIAHWINETIRTLVDIRTAISEDQGANSQENDAALLALFQHAKTARDQWLLAPSGQRPGEGQQMSHEELAPPSVTSMLMGNPANFIKNRRKKDKDD